MSGSKSDYDYNYKTEFQIWKKRNLSAKTFRQANHLWNLLLWVRTQKMQKYHILTQLLLVQKHQTPNHWHYQQNHQKSKKKRKNSMYQRIWIQTHHRHTHHQSNLILMMTANTENQKANNAIKIKSIGNARHRTCQTRCWATLISPTKVIIKAIDAIIRRDIGKGTLSNYA